MRINIIGEINEERFLSLKAQLGVLAESNNIDKLDIHINSPGGEVLYGLQMMSLLNSFNIEKNFYIEFLAASMAADMSMSGDKVYMNKYALLMFHNVYSDSDEVTDSANQYMNKQSKQLADLVIEKRGISKELFYELCKKEAWLTADEAYELGLVDGIIDNLEITDEIKNKLNEIKVEKNFNGIFNIYKKIKNDMNKKYKNEYSDKELEKSKKESEETSKVEEIVEEIVEVLEDKLSPEEAETVIEELMSKVKELEDELMKYKKQEEDAKEEEAEKFLAKAIKDGKIAVASDWKGLLKSDFKKYSTIINNLPSKSPGIIKKTVILPAYEQSTKLTFVEMLKTQPEALRELRENNYDAYMKLYNETYKNKKK